MQRMSRMAHLPTYLRQSPVVDLRISTPEERTRLRNPKHPHSVTTIAQVRRLIETTTTPQVDIANACKVDKGTVSRWMNKFGWKRPEGAAPSFPHVKKKKCPTPLPSSAEVSRRLRIQAERLVWELEEAPSVDPQKLAEALALLDQAREAHRVRQPRKPKPPRRPRAIAPRPGVKTPEERRAAVECTWSRRYRQMHEHEIMSRKENPRPPPEPPRPQPRIRTFDAPLPRYPDER